MATWKSALVLGLVGAALAAGCVVKESDDDDGEGGEGAESGESGSGGTTSGTSGRSGSSGTSGSSGKGGSSGSSGSSSGTSGTAGEGGTGNTSAGGEGGTEPEPGTSPECDPDSGDLPSEPYPTCEPVEGLEDDPCQLCMQESCCEEVKDCYGFSPDNVCGWGGEDGEGEIFCYQQCIADYVAENEVCTLDGENDCIAKCVTAECDQIGNQTMALSACLWDECPVECFGTADACSE